MAVSGRYCQDLMCSEASIYKHQSWAATIAAPHLDTITQPQVPQNKRNDDVYMCLSVRTQGTEESSRSGVLDSPDHAF